MKPGFSNSLPHLKPWIPLTHTAQPAPSAPWALCLQPHWDFYLDQVPSCLQGHSSYNGLLSAVLLASDFSEGLGSHSIFSPGPALLSCQFLSCFSVLLFPLQLCCALLLLFTGVVFSALHWAVATALNASWSPQQTALFRCVTLAEERVWSHSQWFLLQMSVFRVQE